MRKLLYVLGALAVIILVGVYFLFNGMGEIKRLEIGNVDLSKLSDGVYRGEFHKGRWNYKLAVTVKDHAITGIEVLNRNYSGKFSQEAIAKVISEQSIKLDAISGASVDSKAFLKAVENALTSAPM